MTSHNPQCRKEQPALTSSLGLWTSFSKHESTDIPVVTRIYFPVVLRYFRLLNHKYYYSVFSRGLFVTAEHGQKEQLVAIVENQADTLTGDWINDLVSLTMKQMSGFQPLVCRNFLPVWKIVYCCLTDSGFQLPTYGPMSIHRCEKE